MEQVYLENEDINRSILEERNKEIKEIESEIEDLAEISRSLSFMLKSQEEFIDQVDKTLETTSINVEEGTTHLKKALIYWNNTRNTFKNIVLVFGGGGLGALGFIGGPLIGLATTVSGIVVGVGAVAVSEKTRD